MEKVDKLIIGAGVIGLSVAKVLSEVYDDVVVVDKERSFGLHTSSRNSEVLHSGIYYPQNSYKAKLCVKGLNMLYNFARNNNIQYNNCGKLIVATQEEEIPELIKLKENGVKNGVQDLELIEEDECKNLEPQIKAVKALKVKSTGIIDTHELMQKLEKKAEENGAFLVYKMEVVSINRRNDSYQVNFGNGDIFVAQTVINCAGLHSDRIASKVGISLKREKLKLHWCKGEYYKSNRIQNIEHLIYPLPDPTGVSLGIHLTINLNSEVRFGPNAYYVNELDYKMDEKYKQEFLSAINRYIEVEADELHLDDCGIRPKLQGPNDDFRDFYIKEESDKNLPNFINAIGIESPGLTSCLAIAERIKDLLN